jgi:hypothetical protein
MSCPRVALIGNCQANPLPRILKFLAPGLQVTQFPIHDLTSRFPAKEDVFRELARSDLIYSQPFGPGLHPSVDGLVIRERFRSCFYFYPIVEFNAFHPDCVYIYRRTPRGFAQSPIGDYHSAIAFLGYSLGFTAERTLALFNAEVFERLGYFRFWQVSEEVFLQQGRAIEFPLEPIYRSWVRRSPFMHSVNHPRLFVTADIAHALLRQSGLGAPFGPGPGNVESYFPDEALFDPVWPIYPEIAEAMGLEGAYVFKCGSLPSAVRDDLFLNLREFVERSFELYREQKPGNLECSRIEEWTRNAPLLEYLRSR